MNLRTSQSATLVWLLLIAITLVSWTCGSSHELAALDIWPFANIAMLMLAGVKVRLIMRHFMEVRRAPPALRWVCDGWIVLVCVALIVSLSARPPT